MKRAAILLLTLTLLTPTARADEDTREPAPRTASERTFILGEMRKFLASVQAITADLATGDTRAAATEAAARGRRVNAVLAKPPGLDTKETAAWKSMMGGARKGFDSLADTINADASTPRVLTVFADTMSNCVACHQSYRLTAEAQ